MVALFRSFTQRVQALAHSNEQAASVICAALAGVFLGIFMYTWLTKSRNKISGIFQGLVRFVALLIGLCLTMLTIETVFALVGGKNWFLLFLVLDIIAFLVPFCGLMLLTHNKDVAQMQDNAVLKTVVELAVRHKATAIYCCADGCRVIYDQHPHEQGGKRTLSLKTEKEYNNYPYRPRSLRDMAVSNPSCVVDLPFSKFSYPNMLDGTMAVFAEAFCQSVPGYEYHRGEVYVEYTRPATIGVSGLTETSTGYTAKYSETKENKLSKRVDYYGVILPSVQKVKAEAPPPSPKPKNQW